MGPGKIRALLHNSFPGRLDVPSETEIQTVIARLVLKFKNAVNKKAYASLRSSSTPKQTISLKYRNELTRIFLNNPSILPSTAWKIFVQKCPKESSECNKDACPTQSKANQLISSMKTTLKNKNKLPRLLPSLI